MSNHSAAHATLDALGDPMRRQITETLGLGPLPVGELAATLPIGRPAVSKHLRVLTEAGIVQHTSIGTRNLYALAPGALGPVQVWLTETWDAALTSFATHIEQKAQP